jgi:peptide/nickel transport system ATP-binding protein
MISHDLGVIEHMSDRIAVMYLGRIVETSDWRRIFEAPAHPYTRALLDAIPDPETPSGPALRVTGELPSALAPPSGCAFHPRCPRQDARCRAEAPDLVAHATDHWLRCHHPL